MKFGELLVILFMEFKKEYIALVDCNNFYASCERLFNPKLKNKPLIVLSNNDGCVISRSNEVKKLNIPVGAPIFKYKDLIRKHNINLLSSNFYLYDNLSKRVIKYLLSFGFSLEVYSVDEAFLKIKTEPSKLKKILFNIQNKITKDVGIPISIGASYSKTLAKLAARTAKKQKGHVFILENEYSINSHLKNVKVSDIWGIGKQLNIKMKSLGLNSGYDFKSSSLEYIKQIFNKNVIDTFLELNSESVIKVLDEDSKSKSISTSRSLSKETSDINVLNQYLASFIHRVHKKMSIEDLRCQQITVYVRTNYFGKGKQYSNLKKHNFLTPQFDLSVLTQTGIGLLKDIYKSEFRYKKIGVLLTKLKKIDTNQDLLFDKNNFDTQKKLNKTCLSLNSKYEKDLIMTAESSSKNFNYKKINSFISPRYTSLWEDIPKI